MEGHSQGQTAGHVVRHDDHRRRRHAAGEPGPGHDGRPGQVRRRGSVPVHRRRQSLRRPGLVVPASQNESLARRPMSEKQSPQHDLSPAGRNGSVGARLRGDRFAGGGRHVRGHRDRRDLGGRGHHANLPRDRGEIVVRQAALRWSSARSRSWAAWPCWPIRGSVWPS